MQKYRLLLLGLIVIGTLLGSFHHHDNALSSSDCQVCIVQLNLDGANSVDSFVLEKIYTKIDTSSSYKSTFYSTTNNLNTLSRAPPSFS